MAQLTLNPNERVEGELTEDEKDSLKVGEQLQAAEEQLLAGKYKDAQDLEKAYIELQKKLGEPRAETPEPEPEPESQPEPVQEEPQQESEPVTEDFFEELWNESQNDSGEYSDSIIDRLSKMDPSDVAQAYLDYRANQSGITPLNKADIAAIHQSVGGSESYGQMTQWAQENLSQDDRSMFDHVISLGDAPAAYFASQVLAMKYKEAVGYEGQMVHGGNPTPDKKDVFRSQAELVRAMSDPRYEQDPAYRQDVADKLEQSNIVF